MSKKLRKKNTGSTLIEVLVAILVVGLVITAVMLSITYSVKNSAEARYREVASQMAQDAMEVVVLRRQVDTWSDFYNKQTTGIYCVSGATLTYLSSGNCPTVTNGSKTFTRFIQFKNKSTTASGTDSFVAKVTVQWTSDSNVTQNVEIEQKFYEQAI